MNEPEHQLQQEIIQSIGASFAPTTSLTIFKDKLAAHLDALINENLEGLVQILYRLDVSEKKLKNLLATENKNAGILIASLIIERQQQKIISRKHFRQPNTEDIADEERW
jgi:hypothetical protein